MIVTIINKFFISIVCYLLMAGMSYILAMVVISIANKAKDALKRKGAIYV